MIHLNYWVAPGIRRMTQSELEEIMRRVFSEHYYSKSFLPKKNKSDAFGEIRTLRDAYGLVSWTQGINGMTPEMRAKIVKCTQKVTRTDWSCDFELLKKVIDWENDNLKILQIRPYVYFRQMHIYLSYRYSGLSFRKSGQFWGKDHATAVNAVAKCELMYWQDKRYAFLFDKICEKIPYSHDLKAK